MRSRQFHARFLLPAQLRQNPSPQEVSALDVRLEPQRRIDHFQSQFRLLLFLIQLRQSLIRTGHLRVSFQCLAVGLLCVLIPLHPRVQRAKLVVCVGEIRVLRDLLMKLRLGAFVLARAHIRDSEIQMDEREARIQGQGTFQFRGRLGNFIAPEIRFPQNQMKLRPISAHHDHLFQDFFVQLFLA